MERNRLAEKCFQAIRASNYWTPRTKDNGHSITNLICPVCGDKSAWANELEPYSINCNKSNTCGVYTKTRELFNITLDIEKEYKPTKANPHLPATEYLKSRGLTKTSMTGLDYRYWKKTRENVRGGAVMFLVSSDKTGKMTLNGRLFNPPAKDKSHNFGSTSGKFWCHNAQPLDKTKPVFVTEGIIDSLSFYEFGQQAIAVLAAGQDPSKISGLDEYSLVCAFDNDEAGAKATKKYLAHFPKATAIMSPSKHIDWNDILVKNKGNAEKYFKDNYNLFEQNAELALADNAQHYGKLYYDFKGTAPGLFTFNGSTWFGSLRVKGENTSLVIERLGLFTIDVLSFINVGDETRKEYLYQLRVKPYKQQPIICVASAKAFTGVRDFNAFLLSSAKVNFEGKVNALTALATKITLAKVAEVRQIAVCGYDPASNWYVFDSHAVDEKGKIQNKDKNGNFKFDHKTMIAPAPQSADKAIHPAKKPTVDIKTIYTLFHKAWGNNGAMAFSWTFASWFVNQIKEKENFFPFLSLHGDPAAGKSALTEKLQALQGRNTEGLPLSQLNTKKGLARTMAGFSGMFTALLEDSQRNERAFDYSILLTAYNRGSLQVQAKFTQSLETKENPFLGALLFVQNSEPFNQKAEKQRVISLSFKTEDLTTDTRKAFNELNNLPKEELAKVMLEVLKKRTEIEETWFNEYRIAAADLEAISEERIRNNHALILSFHRIFCNLFKINLEEADIYNHVEEVGLAKEKSSAELETNEASLFFEKVLALDSSQAPNYWHEVEPEDNATNHNTLYVSLTLLERLLSSSGMNPPRIIDIASAIKQHPAFLKNGISHRFKTSAAESHTVVRKAWALDLTKFREIEKPPYKINWDRYKNITANKS